MAYYVGQTDSAEKMREQYSFKPKINRNSMLKEDESEPGLTRYDMLLKKGEKYKEKIDIQREIKTQKEVEGCTFEPILNDDKNRYVHSKIKTDYNSSKYNSKKSKKNNNNRNEPERYLNSQGSEDILRYTDSVKKSQKESDRYSSNNHESTNLEKKRKSRQERSENIESQFQTFGSKKEDQRPIPEQKTDFLKVPTIPEKEVRFSSDLAQSPEQEDTPILFLDVNFGHGNITRIVMYENDTPEELAEAFCLEHKLDDSKKVKLIAIIKKHLENILDKIVEQPYEE